MGKSFQDRAQSGVVSDQVGAHKALLLAVPWLERHTWVSLQQHTQASSAGSCSVLLWAVLHAHRCFAGWGQVSLCMTQSRVLGDRWALTSCLLSGPGSHVGRAAQGHTLDLGCALCWWLLSWPL